MQTALTASSKSKQLLLFAFALQKSSILISFYEDNVEVTAFHIHYYLDDNAFPIMLMMILCSKLTFL